MLNGLASESSRINDSGILFSCFARPVKKPRLSQLIVLFIALKRMSGGLAAHQPEACQVVRCPLCHVVYHSHVPLPRARRARGCLICLVHSMHTAVLPSSLFSMRSYTSWTPTIDQYAFQSSFAALLTEVTHFRMHLGAPMLGCHPYTHWMARQAVLSTHIPDSLNRRLFDTQHRGSYFLQRKCVIALDMRTIFQILVAKTISHWVSWTLPRDTFGSLRKLSPVLSTTNRFHNQTSKSTQAAKIMDLRRISGTAGSATERNDDPFNPDFIAHTNSDTRPDLSSKPSAAECRGSTLQSPSLANDSAEPASRPLDSQRDSLVRRARLAANFARARRDDALRHIAEVGMEADAGIAAHRLDVQRIL